VLRGDVLLVAALLLEVDGGGDVGELQHVDAEAVGRALGGDLGVEGPGLGAHVVGLDLGEVLAEALQEGRDAGLAVVAVVDDLAFLLRLRDVRAGVEVEHLGVLGGALRGGGTDRAQDGRGGQQRARLQDLTATDAMGLVIGHGGSSSSTGIGRERSCSRGIAGSICQIAPAAAGILAAARSYRYQRRKISKTFRSPPRQ
jgi:hypothetical protein